MSYLRTSSAADSSVTPTLAYVEPPVSPTPVNARPPQPAPQPAPVVPAATPVTASVPPPPVRAYEPVVPPPVAPPAPAPVAPPAPAPAPAPPVAAAPAPVDQTVAIFLHLTSGERIFVGRFDSEQIALDRAKDIVRALVRPEPGVWAKFGTRLVRPDAVVSLELAERRDD